MPGTIDAVIAGGSSYGGTGGDGLSIQKKYLDSINLLGQEVKSVLGFEPIVINGPKSENLLVDDLYYDNENRRLYFIRSEVNSKAGNFSPSDAEKHQHEWNNLNL